MPQLPLLFLTQHPLEQELPLWLGLPAWCYRLLGAALLAAVLFCLLFRRDTPKEK